MICPYYHVCTPMSYVRAYTCYSVHTTLISTCMLACYSLACHPVTETQNSERFLWMVISEIVRWFMRPMYYVYFFKHYNQQYLNYWPIKHPRPFSDIGLPLLFFFYLGMSIVHTQRRFEKRRILDLNIEIVVEINNNFYFSMIFLQL